MYKPEPVVFVGFRRAPVQNQGDSGGYGRLKPGHNYFMKQPSTRPVIPQLIVVYDRGCELHDLWLALRVDVHFLGATYRVKPS